MSDDALGGALVFGPGKPQPSDDEIERHARRREPPDEESWWRSQEGPAGGYAPLTVIEEEQ